MQKQKKHSKEKKYHCKDCGKGISQKEKAESGKCGRCSIGDHYA